ncbi:DNA repair protein [Lasiodiplodia theobromae]|uniref:DNA repair protein n=1 Tax=Lasiodiplodia theobromae TaxID=45133 RepID=UPI0015C36CED|nr:DNA repair protein [Lasiodiplodia theobromae]KAF4541277.1 DNA repair protein [Lasiodiplodia theobromae]
MLVEAAADNTEDARPLKKRKVETSAEEPALPNAVDRESSNGLEDEPPKLQTIIDDSESDDSDMDWEEVDLNQQNSDAVLPPLTKAQAEETLQIEIGNDDTKNKPARARRKAATAAERAMRLHIHKMHVLCLLYNAHIRNAWCNDDKVQSSLKRFRSSRIINLFTPDPNQSQLAASKAFNDGLILAKDAWKKFKITSLGLRRAKWAHDTKELEVFKIPENADPVMDISDFRKAAVSFEGSPDTAFEDNGVAKDVTRRYAKAYNAKTRKLRVESTENGDRWWRKALKLFRRRTILDRDQVEDAELSRREAQEEMPKNVQDFKDHPYYVLERHLKHNEVIHPKRECGKVNVGTAATTNLEPIYRRRDVHQLKSADKWYRLGREIKPGEQPLKHAKPRRSRQRQPFADDDGENEDAESLGAALYAPFQTELYVPPPCVRGRVPRNAFGNLDVYVPSMVPPGGAHIRDARARIAARMLAVDYADAVTGFTFRGRHGTAVVEGVVVAEENAEAVRAVLEGMRDAEQDDERERRGREAVRLWRKFLLGLRVLERVQEYASADERKQMEKEMRERVEAEEREEQERVRAEEMAGGFFLAEGAGEKPAEPTAGRMLAAAGHDEEYYDGGDGGGFLPDEGGEEEKQETGDDLFKSRIMENAPVRRLVSHQGFDGADDDRDSVGGGGFLPEEGGGFAPEDEDRSIPEGGGGFVLEDGGGFLPDGGGGFIPDEEDVGGGFVREDTTAQQSVNYISPKEPQDQQDQDVKAEAPPVASKSPEAADALDEPAQQQRSTGDQDKASQPVRALSQEPGPTLDTQPQGSNIGQLDLEGDAQPSRTKAQWPKEVEQAADPEQASSGDDADSLPSHDPEDEDAEPEWLAEEVVSD